MLDCDILKKQRNKKHLYIFEKAKIVFCSTTGQFKILEN